MLTRKSIGQRQNFPVKSCYICSNKLSICVLIRSALMEKLEVCNLNFRTIVIHCIHISMYNKSRYVY